MSTLNFTQRIEIPRGAVEVMVEHAGTDRRELTVTIDFADVDVSADAPVFVEVQHRGRYKRFSYGVVGEVQAPKDRRIGEFATDAPTVTILVVDPTDYHVLAARHNLRPSRKDKNRTEILPVEMEDLGQTLWQLRQPFEPAGPILKITNQLPGLETNMTFRAFVLPEAFRSVLQTILLDPNFNEEDESWKRAWIEFATERADEQAPKPEGEDRRIWLADNDEAVHHWIDGAVQVFADEHRLLDRYQEESGGSDS